MKKALQMKDVGVDKADAEDPLIAHLRQQLAAHRGSRGQSAPLRSRLARTPVPAKSSAFDAA